MTTGNKPTAALQYPAMGSLARQAAADRDGRAAVRHVRGPARTGTAGGAGYLGTGYNPFVHRRGRRPGKHAAANFRVRGITLPNGVHPRRPGEARPAAPRRSTTGFRSSIEKRTTWWTGWTRSTSRRSRSCGRTRRRRRSTWRPRQQTVRDSYGNDAVRPGRAGGPPAGRGRGAVRHRRHRRVGHAPAELHARYKTRLLPQPRHDALGPDPRPGRRAACWTARS